MVSQIIKYIFVDLENWNLSRFETLRLIFRKVKLLSKFYFVKVQHDSILFNFGIQNIETQISKIIKELHVLKYPTSIQNRLFNYKYTIFRLKERLEHEYEVSNRNAKIPSV